MNLKITSLIVLSCFLVGCLSVPPHKKNLEKNHSYFNEPVKVYSLINQDELGAVEPDKGAAAMAGFITFGMVGMMVGAAIDNYTDDKDMRSIEERTFIATQLEPIQQQLVNFNFKEQFNNRLGKMLREKGFFSVDSVIPIKTRSELRNQFKKGEKYLLIKTGYFLISDFSFPIVKSEVTLRVHVNWRDDKILYQNDFWYFGDNYEAVKTKKDIEEELAEAIAEFEKLPEIQRTKKAIGRRNKAIIKAKRETFSYERKVMKTSKYWSSEGAEKLRSSLDGSISFLVNMLGEDMSDKSSPGKYQELAKSHPGYPEDNVSFLISETEKRVIFRLVDKLNVGIICSEPKYTNYCF